MIDRFRRRVMAAALHGASLVALTMPIAPAAAQQPDSRAFNIPAQNLGPALEAYGQQSGKAIMFDPARLAGARSRSVQGRFAPDAALRRLLEGTGFQARRVNANTFVIQAAGGNGEGASGGPVEAPQIEEPPIVVTGSRIARPEIEGSAPLVASISERDLARRSFTNVADALNEVPGFGVPVSSAGGQSQFSVGQNFVNLFGLGTQRTLALVNGRRFVSSNTASNFGGADPGLQVDLNVIPVSLIGRIDVLTVKGATTYGADAIAGTVNLILREDFDGLEVTGQYGVSGRGDMGNYFGSVTYGSNFADDRGNFAINVEYERQNSLLPEQRQRTRDAFFLTSSREPGSPYLVGLYDNYRVAAFTNGGVPGRVDFFAGPPTPLYNGFRDAAGNIVRFGTSGDLVPYDLGIVDGVGITASGGDGYNSRRFPQILSDLRRFTTFVTSHYNIASNVTAFVEANYASIEATDVVPLGIFQTDLNGGKDAAIGALLSNPFLTAQARQTLLLPENLADAGGNQILNFDTDGDGVNDDTRFVLQRSSIDLTGDSPTQSSMDLFRIVGGLRGDFELGDRPFNWNLSYSWGRSRATSYNTQIIQQNFINALDVVLDGNGNPACRITVDPTSTLNVTRLGAAVPGGNCVPLNLFGEGQPSQAAIDYVTARVVAESENTQGIINANVGGELFSLSGNPVAFNVGFERRTEEQNFTPDGFLAQGLGRAIPYPPITGRYRTNELFGEVLVPIVQPANSSFIHLFELDGSIRYIDNSLAGSATVWSVGGRLAPIAGLLFRGSYTSSVRSPAVTELFLPPSRAFVRANDPCDAAFITSGTAPNIRAANCAAEGIPAGFNSFLDEAGLFINDSGNPNLRNERSRSWTAGIIVEPRLAPRLVLTADWVNIRISNAIIRASLDDVLSACYDTTDYPSAPACGQFSRDGSGQITSATAGYVNAASFRFAGLQASLRYAMDVGPGRADVQLRYFYIDRFERDLNGLIDTFDGEVGASKHELLATMGYELGRTGAALTGRFISGANLDNEAAPNLFQFPRVGSYFETSLSIWHGLTDRVQVRATVDNLFDADIPFPDFYSGAASNTYISGLLGRRFKIGATFRF